MPMLGEMEFPLTSPEVAASLGRKLLEQFRGRPFDAEACASALGYKSSKNGAFRQVLADLRKYGLLTGRGDALQTTELLGRAASPAGAPLPGGAVAEMMGSVPLFRELYQHYQGAVPTEEELVPTLIGLTRADRAQVEGWAPRIRRLLVAGWPRGEAGRPSVRPLSVAPGPSPPDPDPDLPGAEHLLRASFFAGPVRLEFPLTPLGLRLLRANLESAEFWKLISTNLPATLEPSEPPRPAGD